MPPPPTPIPYIWEHRPLMPPPRIHTDRRSTPTPERGATTPLHFLGATSASGRRRRGACFRCTETLMFQEPHFSAGRSLRPPLSTSPEPSLPPPPEPTLFLTLLQRLLPSRERDILTPPPRPTSRSPR